MRDKFQLIQGAIASYDYFDLSARTGYKRFYPIVNNEGNKLITEAIESNDFRSGGSSAGDPVFTHNYDLIFNAPNIIEGVAFITATMEVNPTGTGTALLKATIQKISSGITTTIGSQLSSDTLSTATSKTRRVTLHWTLSRTHFAIDDTLRLVVTFHTTNPSASGSWLYHDPANRGALANEEFTGQAPNTNFIFYVPFKVTI